jgi:predicted DNA-binding transcriptional regulator YafY
MKTAARFSMQRIDAFDRAVRAGNYPNARSFAAELEVGRRTVQRDIEFLRYRLRAPLEFDPRRNGYHYTDHDYRLSFLELGDDELVALVLAQAATRQLGAPFAAGLAGAVRKIVLGLKDGAEGDPAGALSFLQSAATPLGPALYRDLDDAIRGHKRLAVRYWSASRDEETRREVDPYHLAWVDGQYFLIGFCHLRNEVRMFAAPRVRSLEPTGATFAPPEGFRVDDYLAGSLAVMRGKEGEAYHVLLRFTGGAVRYVAERAWHPSQTAEPAPGGALLVGLTLSHLREVERWALSWGADCVVLEPPELRDRVARAVAKAHALYFPPAACDAVRPEGH